MAQVLIDLLGGQVEAIVAGASDPPGADPEDDEEEKRITARVDVPETEKIQLINARRGQGLFRSRVELVERGCRVTGLTDRAHLRASHIKPWRESTDKEKLDGENGLLLSPHVDHLFDQGYLTFSDQGEILISPKLQQSVLASWALGRNGRVGDFSPRQKEYLVYHRLNVFKA